MDDVKRGGAYWNPYMAGVLLGLVLLASYLLAGRGLGASGAFSSVAAWLGARVFRAHDVAATRRTLDMVAVVRGDLAPARTVRGLA